MCVFQSVSVFPRGADGTVHCIPGPPAKRQIKRGSAFANHRDPIAGSSPLTPVPTKAKMAERRKTTHSKSTQHIMLSGFAMGRSFRTSKADAWRQLPKTAPRKRIAAHGKARSHRRWRGATSAGGAFLAIASTFAAGVDDWLFDPDVNHGLAATSCIRWLLPPRAGG